MPTNRITFRRDQRLKAKARQLARSREADAIDARLREIGTYPGFLVEPDDPLGTKFRPLSGSGRALRTLPEGLVREGHRQAQEFYIRNPLINRIANIHGDFIAGDGARVSSPDPAAQAALDHWWQDGVNNWEENQFVYAREFPLRGEWIPERVLNAVTADIRLNPLDPLAVLDVSGHAAYNLIPSRITFGVEIEQIQAQIVNTLPRELQNPSVLIPRVYYFRMGQSTGDLRGHSAFLTIFEWADSLDNAAFSLLERMINLQAFLWHFKSAAARDEKEKKALERKLSGLRGQSALITGLEDEVEAKVPQLGSAEFSEGFSLVRQIIAAGGATPENYLGVGGTANIGEAASMDVPTIKAMIREQREFLGAIRAMAKDQIREKIRVRAVPATTVVGGKPIPTEETVTVTAAPPSKKEMGQVATTLGLLASSLPTALDENWITAKEGQQLWRTVASGIIDMVDDLPAQNPDEADRLIRKAFPEDAVNGLRKAVARFGDLPTRRADLPPARNGSASA